MKFIIGKEEQINNFIRDNNLQEIINLHIKLEVLEDIIIYCN